MWIMYSTDDEQSDNSAEEQIPLVPASFSEADWVTPSLNGVDSRRRRRLGLSVMQECSVDARLVLYSSNSDEYESARGRYLNRSEMLQGTDSDFEVVMQPHKSTGSASKKMDGNLSPKH